MVGLFFVIFLLVTIFFVVKSIKEWKSQNRDERVFAFYSVATVISGFVCILFLIWVCILIDRVGTGYIIDSKVALYEEENTLIEQSIDVTVKSYIDLEASTYGKLKDKDAINLVPLFQTLKSDTLVQKQIEIYITNKNKIKELKQEKINLSKSKWKLYFGR